MPPNSRPLLRLANPVIHPMLPLNILGRHFRTRSERWRSHRHYCHLQLRGIAHKHIFSRLCGPNIDQPNALHMQMLLKWHYRSVRMCDLYTITTSEIIVGDTVRPPDKTDS